MKRILGSMLVSTLLLGACNTDSESDTEESETEESISAELETETASADVEETESDIVSDEEETDLDEELTDAEVEDGSVEAVDLSVVMDEDFEEIDWDEVQLTRDEFDSILFEMQEDLNSDYEEDDEMAIVIDSIDFSGDTIHMYLTNHDESDFADFTSGFFAVFLDSLYRQLYLHSDYSDGTTHPRIIIQHTDGEVITDQDEFIEFEE